MSDKTMTAEQVVAELEDGMTLGIGGWGSRRKPMALVRAILRRPDDVTDFGDARLWSETTRIDLRVAEVANPRPGDRIEIDGDAFLIQGEPVRDRERLVWTVDLRPA